MAEVWRYTTIQEAVCNTLTLDKGLPSHLSIREKYEESFPLKQHFNVFIKTFSIGERSVNLADVVSVLF